MLSDIEIARQNVAEPIAHIASSLGLLSSEYDLYGAYKAKIKLNALYRLINTDPDKRARLVLVTAITPTDSGEGKSTISIGLADALCKIGKKTVLALREPSLGPYRQSHSTGERFMHRSAHG